MAGRSPRSTTISGELVDTFCYAHNDITGEAHAACAVKCIHAGVPAGIIDEKTKRLFILFPPEDAGKLPEALIARAGHRVTIDGELLVKGEERFLTVVAFR